MTITLRDLLNDGKVHVLDGAMGTMLYSKGFFLNVCYDELNLKQPKLVQEVHAAYVRAGAEILETNTFGANPAKLGSFGLADDTEKINQAAAELARAAGGGQTSAVGAIGPLGVRIEPFGALAREEAFAHFQRQVTGLVAGGRGVDGFILETFSDVDELHEALRAVRSLSDLPVIAQMTIGDDGLTHYGTAPETFAQQLAEWGADVIGVNCSVGPAGVLEAVEKMVKVTDRPISAVPNAGLPKDVGDRKIYLASPEYMASYARRMIEAGARIVGGCCGTTPEHIKKIRDYVASVVPRHQPVVVSRETVTHYSCRDRNLLGMLSDVLGAAAAGLRNILIITGDPPKMGPYPDATAEFEIGVGVDPAAIDLDRELSRFAWKVDAGADFAVTQPVFDPKQLADFLKRVEQFRIPIVAGIWPLVSLRNAEFLANEVPGVSVPETVLARMKQAQEKGKEAALAEGVAIAREMFKQVKSAVQGIQVSAPFGRVEVALEVFGG